MAQNAQMTGWRKRDGRAGAKLQRLPEALGAASTEDLLPLASVAGPSLEQEANSQPATAATSQNTTPRDTPPSTPGLARRMSGVPALKLNLDDTTWSTVRPPKAVGATHLAQRKEEPKRSGLANKAAKALALVRQSRTPEFRFRLVLAVLFVSIVSVVVLTWHLHEAFQEATRLSTKSDFDPQTRRLRLLDRGGRTLLQGELGQVIPPALEAHICPVLHLGYCYEWKYRARLEMRVAPMQDEIACYEVHWRAASVHTELVDCYDLTGAHWFGMGEVGNLSWPLANLQLNTMAFETGRADPLGSVLEPYWLSSRGVSILASPNQALMFSFNASGSERLCLAAKEELNYTLCTGPDVLAIHKASAPHRPEPSNFTAAEEVFVRHPVLVPRPGEDGNLTQATVHEYANRFVNHGFNGGFVLIRDGWQYTQGDLAFWKEAFPHPAEIVRILHNKGNKVLLDVHPYFCLNSINFRAAMDGEYLLADQSKVPLLTRWNGSLCAVVNLFEERAADWFLEQLRELNRTLGVDGFVFRGGQARALPYGQGRWASAFLGRYLKVAARSSPLLGTPGGAGFVTLAPQPSTWAALQGILPKVLTLGLLGHRVVSPGCVGGDLVAPGTKPERELYFRWWQLAVFLPVLQFSVLPSDYNDDFELTKVSRVLTQFRKTRVEPAMKEALEEAAPLVRPLWWLDPRDHNTYGAGHQFALGNNLIVAPVLEPGRNSAYVYLPQGWWCEDQKLHRGGKWISVTAPLEKVTYFSRSDKC
ncbi:myogenesis-regulating glycosidase isoform X2 [Rhipicephalus microplus]|uniref:myogenesis-regulating glycosidase isoform X2 n=2 Tax=Rhipicephalus microplus TaxID=6941 RepID=UPI0018883DE4|nr:myogenesis-regulating glycosidase-like isoform X1 [Rhipicephalus microplus]